MRVLVGCEFSGVVRDAFLKRGHDAVSCDLEPSETAGPHIRDDIIHLLEEDQQWNLLVAFPPCTYLAASGARWWPGRIVEQAYALAFVRMLMQFPIPKIAIMRSPMLDKKQFTCQMFRRMCA